ncbi:MAG: bifunctional riboflavin kinase/FAD synthetase [Lachnospiraceae bacterium]|nr:bifunctional riboflavin kinase/FAD synthetase [Lachnospiraceae bacterium]MBQ9234632.1 bifunctional riboflavin kinase/FAD synthetase [Lachnospiraceae bacterium]
MEVIAYDKAQLNNTAVALGKFEGVHKGHMLLIGKIVELAHNEHKNPNALDGGDEGVKSVVFTINMPNEIVINLDSERYDIFESCDVDYVCECPFDERISRLSPYEFINNILVEKLHASYVVVGEDFRFGYKRAGDIETLRKYAEVYNYEVVVFEKLRLEDKIISSTIIRELIEKGDVETVDKYMGRPYSVSGKVVYGKQLGRVIGFPTVNLIPDKRKKLPMVGAYETRIYIENDKTAYKAITNVGNNPTVNESVNSENNADIIIETHILDYSGDLYGKDIKVDFIRFLRPEMKFDNIEELKNQLKEDKDKVNYQI